MRTIKLLTLTALVGLMLAGPASFFATHWIDARTSSGALFITAWIFSGSGIIASAIGIGSSYNNDKFGTPEIVKELFGDVLGTLAVITLVGFGFIGLVTVAIFAPAIWLTMTVAFGAGSSIGFLAQLFVVVDETWTGEATSAGSSHLRRIS